MNYTIGLDIGSTNVKGVLLSEKKEIVAKHSVKFEYDTPKAGYVEIGAKTFIEDCFQVISELAGKLPEGGCITGISEASASGNLLLLDKDGQPLTPIINWQDKRVTDEVKEVLGEDFDYQSYYEKIGWRLFTQFPLAQLCYIKKHTPEILARSATVCMSTEYFNYILTGRLGIGPSAGTPFFLIDQNTNQYDDEILHALGITEDMLPPVMKTGEELGSVLPEVALAYGLTTETKVYCGTFDHPAAAISTGITEEGEMLLSCGTSWVAFMPIRERSVILDNRFLCDPFLRDEGGPYGAMCSVSSVGNKVSELVERYFGNRSDRYDRLKAYAEKSVNGAGGLVITDTTSEQEILSFPRENIAYAIMEMPARLLKEKLSDFMKQGIKVKRIVAAGGPTKIPIWVSIIEGMMESPVTVTNAEYSGAVGAAMLAASNTFTKA